MSKKHVFEPKNTVVLDGKNFKVKGRKKATLLYKVYMNLLARGYDVKWIDASATDGKSDGISILPDSCEDDSVAPVISNEMIKSIFQPGMNITQLADQVREMMSGDFIKTLYILNKMEDREYVFSNVEVEVCKAAWNKDILANTLYREIEGTDLVAYVKIRLDEALYANLLKVFLSPFDYKPEEIFKAAQENSWKEYCIETMNSEGEISPCNGQDDVNNIHLVHYADYGYVITLLLNNQTLRHFYEMVGNRKIYILPFAPYTFGFIPKDALTTAEVINQMQTINAGNIHKETIVTDQVYCYDGSKLSLVCEG